MIKQFLCWWYGHIASTPVKIGRGTYEQTCKRCGKKRWEEWSDSGFGEVTYTKWI